MTLAYERLHALRLKHPTLGEDAKLGFAAAFCKKADVADKPGGETLVWCVASTADVDLEGDVVIPEGGDMTTYFGKNKNIFLDHIYTSEAAVARCRKIELGPQGWVCQAALNKDMDNPYVRAAYSLAREGGLGMSIGFQELEGSAPTPEERKSHPGAEWIVRKWKCLEISFTALPMNVSCRTLNVTTDASKAAESLELLRKAGTPELIVRAMGLAGDNKGTAKLARRLVVIE